MGPHAEPSRTTLAANTLILALQDSRWTSDLQDGSIGNIAIYSRDRGKVTLHLRLRKEQQQR